MSARKSLETVVVKNGSTRLLFKNELLICLHLLQSAGAWNKIFMIKFFFFFCGSSHVAAQHTNYTIDVPQVYCLSQAAEIQGDL